MLVPPPPSGQGRAAAPPAESVRPGAALAARLVLAWPGLALEWLNPRAGPIHPPPLPRRVPHPGARRPPIRGHGMVPRRYWASSPPAWRPVPAALQGPPSDGKLESPQCPLAAVEPIPLFPSSSLHPAAGRVQVGHRGGGVEGTQEESLSEWVGVQSCCKGCFQ